HDALPIFGLRHSLEQQHHGPADRRNIDRLKRGVQHQYRFLHHGRSALRRRGGWQTWQTTIANGWRQDWLILPTYTVVRWVRVHGSGFPRDNSQPVPSRREIARATVRATTLDAPAFRRALEHASSVAPVVSTSSTSKTRRLSTRRP